MEPATQPALARRGRAEGTDYLSHLVSYLRQERQRRGLSLTDLSQGSGLDRGMLCKLENGRIANPTFHTLWRYAMALDARPALVLLDACRAAAEADVGKSSPDRHSTD
jgi:transcriptional regulator with XRE-family HTH domain